MKSTSDITHFHFVPQFWFLLNLGDVGNTVNLNGALAMAATWLVLQNIDPRLQMGAEGRFQSRHFEVNIIICSFCHSIIRSPPFSKSKKLVPCPDNAYITI